MVPEFYCPDQSPDALSHTFDLDITPGADSCCSRLALDTTSLLRSHYLGTLPVPAAYLEDVTRLTQPGDLTISVVETGESSDIWIVSNLLHYITHLFLWTSLCGGQDTK